ncbi:MAG TPA: M23 family metallopeptidase [Chloroflexaceae bacterium]|nr:M23 family metallopeptidase [Chloroflexaceae bacterium]
MYNRWGETGRGGALLLALLVAGFLLWPRPGAGQVRLSGWVPQGPVAQAGLAAGQPAALSGFAGVQQGRGLAGDPRPQGNPLGAPNTVMTQGYGVGTHAPAEIWGAIDLAIDGNGDGAADPDGSWNHPIYATHAGVIKVTPNSHPAGNHVWVTGDEYRTGYSHLADFAVSDGQTVQRGDLIGYLGSTGMSSGPHLDYQVWVKQGGAWVNVNPLDYGALDGAP